MSNFSVNGISPYSSANMYTYLGTSSITPKKLQEIFDEFNISPTGDVNDLKKVKNEIYKNYSEQVQKQIANQNGEQEIPWAGICAQIGVQVTGDKEIDAKAFDNAIRLLSMNTIDGNAMTYFAGLRNEAGKYFNESVETNYDLENSPVSFRTYQAQYWR